MNEIRSVFSGRIQFFGKSEEWFRVVVEKVNVKDGLWVRNSVLLEVVIETSTRGSKGEIINKFPEKYCQKKIGRKGIHVCIF